MIPLPAIIYNVPIQHGKGEELDRGSVFVTGEGLGLPVAVNWGAQLEHDTRGAVGPPPPPGLHAECGQTSPVIIPHYLFYG